MRGEGKIIRRFRKNFSEYGKEYSNTRRERELERVEARKGKSQPFREAQEVPARW